MTDVQPSVGVSQTDLATEYPQNPLDTLLDGEVAICCQLVMGLLATR